MSEQPCPKCGHCPTCGRSNTPSGPGWWQWHPQYTPIYPAPYHWTSGGNLNDSTYTITYSTETN